MVKNKEKLLHWKNSGQILLLRERVGEEKGKKIGCNCFLYFFLLRSFEGYVASIMLCTVTGKHIRQRLHVLTWIYTNHQSVQT